MKKGLTIRDFNQPVIVPFTPHGIGKKIEPWIEVFISMSIFMAVRIAHR